MIHAFAPVSVLRYSDDGGETWATPVQWDPTLIEPVCQVWYSLL